MSYKYEDIRNFYFENEIGQRIDCQKINGNLFFYNVTGLGYEEEIEYVQIGNNFVPNKSKIKQNQICGDLEFYNMTYDEYCNFVDFILTAKELKLVYIPKRNRRTEYFRDIDLFKIDKAEEDEYNILSCPIAMNAKSLWYEQKEIVYDIKTQENEVRWNFRFNSKFVNYNNRNIIFENKGHAEAPIKLEMMGYLINPSILISVNGKELYSLHLNLTLLEGEKLLYFTKDTDLYIYKQDAEGNLTNLFEDLDLNRVNFFKLPKGLCEISLTAENNVQNAKLTIYVEYKAV